ncbi:efflux RND transporter periplasmic adaptor subunit [Roseibacillus ishigakijimensis]|uniref:Efflux RND transporter periplasmic adaptor subunit n=1 Tax=Roseibacillus ishigakijimensis TaxID=454146 RepID=A0A934RNW4_9BACT|nr:efflux RND transporter periplasmic adaptor subunit [Roseibacillus ishigakijimensis]MBK1832783.1 efflux RND transporter periplasmic adaptor subunit [Roseibacillus ishigakijimensis]
MSSESSSATKKQTGGRLLRFLLLAALLAVGVWIGLRTLQKTEPAGATAGGGEAPQGPPPSTVKVTRVEARASQNTHRVVGTIRAVSRADVAAREDGAVIEILVNEGDTVEQHQVLARLDARRLDAQIAQAQASLTAARSLITQREAERERNETDLSMKEKLFAEKAISQAEFLDAERSQKVAGSQEQSARDSLKAAAAALDLLQVRKDDLVIRAPFAGRVVARHIEPGEWLNPGQTAFTLVNSGRVEAWLQVPERFANSVGGSDIVVEVAGRDYPATNLRPVPEANEVTRVLTVIADIEDSRDELVPGLAASAFLPVTEESERLAVPSDALVTTYAGRALYRAQPQQSGLPIAEQLPVTVLFQQDGITYIESDVLQEGDLVVTDGNERLRAGASLAITPAEPQTAAN